MPTFRICDESHALESMLEANAYDEDVCEWLRAARPGDVFDIGHSERVLCEFERFSAEGEAWAMLSDLLSCSTREELAQAYDDQLVLTEPILEEQPDITTDELAAKAFSLVRMFCIDTGVDYDLISRACS
jgi:hypothetical protein